MIFLLAGAILECALSDVERQRLQCEAAYWRKKVYANGRAWWEQQKKRIKKKRGEQGLQYLLSAMNKE